MMEIKIEFKLNGRPLRPGDFERELDCLAASAMAHKSKELANWVRAQRCRKHGRTVRVVESSEVLTMKDLCCEEFRAEITRGLAAR